MDFSQYFWSVPSRLDELSGGAHLHSIQITLIFYPWYLSGGAHVHSTQITLISYPWYLSGGPHFHSTQITLFSSFGICQGVPIFTDRKPFWRHSLLTAYRWKCNRLI